MRKSDRLTRSLAQPPTTITSDGGTDARMEGRAAKSSCSFQKTDLVDNFLLLFLILISPSLFLFVPSSLLLCLSISVPVLLPESRPRPWPPFCFPFSPISLYRHSTPLRSPFQFIRIIPSDRKRPLPPSLRPSQSRSQPSQSVSQSVSPDSGGRRERARKVCQVRRRRRRRRQGRCQRRRTRPLHRGSGRSARRRGEGTEPASASSSGAFGLAVWRRLRSQSPLRPE